MLDTLNLEPVRFICPLQHPFSDQAFKIHTSYHKWFLEVVLGLRNQYLVDLVYLKSAYTLKYV